MAFRSGLDFLNEIADAFGLSKNVCSVRLCVECDSVVTLEVEELVTDEQAKELMPILKRYRLEEIIEPSSEHEVEVTTAGDLAKGFSSICRYHYRLCAARTYQSWRYLLTGSAAPGVIVRI